MRQETAAVFEALSWVEGILIELKNESRGLDKALREVREAIDEIKKGVAVDFPHRLRSV